jgi:hypothetical protein
MPSNHQERFEKIEECFKANTLDTLLLEFIKHGINV